jgi:hypothetical protein
MPYIPFKNPFHRKPKRNDEKPQSRKHNKGRPSADFAALIDTVRDEGRAYRKEEQREDRGKRRREWITIGLIFLTFSAVCYQVYEMIKVYEPIREQAEASKKAAVATVRAADAATRQSENSDRAIVQAQRAWVGPLVASFAAEPSIGKAIEITVNYQNSGHEPAIGFVYSIEPFGADVADDKSGVADARIQNYLAACKNTLEWRGGSVVYPSTGGFGGGYAMNSKTKDDFVTEGMIKGDTLIVVQGCFLYQTFETPKHSYFCYFYRQGMTKFQNLNICIAGHSAN